MNLDRAVLAVAGSIVLLSVLLTAAVSSWWLLLTGFVGLNLLQASPDRLLPGCDRPAPGGSASGCAFVPPDRRAGR